MEILESVTLEFKPIFNNASRFKSAIIHRPRAGSVFSFQLIES